MDKEQVRALIIYVLRSPRVAGEARRLLRPEHFGPEPHFRFLLELLVELLDASDYPKGLVPYMTLYEAVRARSNDDPDALPEECKDWLLWKPPFTPAGCTDGVIYYAHKVISRADLDEEDGLKLLKQFLRERAMSAPLAAVAEAVAGGRVLANYGVIADELRATAERIEGISAGASFGMRPKSGKVDALVIIPTGVPYFDGPLNGGVSPGEVYGVAGPIGGGKSTSMYQLSVSFAKLNPDKLVLHFSYEDPQQSMNRRLWAYAARIDKDVLEKMTDVEADRDSGFLSSKAGGLKPYEVAHYAKFGRPDDLMDGEYDRLMATWEGYKNLRMFDMIQSGVGEGGVDELVNLARIEIGNSKGMSVGLVIIDSIDLILTAQLEASGRDVKEYLRYEINKFPHSVRRKLGKEFGAAVFVTNQIAGEHLKRGSGAKFSHADAAESKGWAKGLDLCLNFGNTEMVGERGDERVTVLNCSKSRRTGATNTHTTVRLVARYGYWEDCGEEYRVHQGMIVSARDIADLVAVDVGLLQRKPQGSQGVSYVDHEWAQ